MWREEEYRVLTTVAGGEWTHLSMMYYVAKREIKDLTVERLKQIISKLIAYNLISAETASLPPFNYKNKLGITRKGSEALEYYKRVRYYMTDKKIYLSKEGGAMITLPGEHARQKVHIQKN